MKPETFMIVTVCVAWAAVAYLATRTDEARPTEPLPLPNANARYQPFVYLDQVTGCEYLSTHMAAALTPRIAADGKTHMGCREVRP